MSGCVTVRKGSLGCEMRVVKWKGQPGSGWSSDLMSRADLRGGLGWGWSRTKVSHQGRQADWAGSKELKAVVD